MAVIINNRIQNGIPDKLMALLSSGQGLFETILYEDDILMFWELHQNRLFNSLAIFNITEPDFDLKAFVLQHIATGPKKESLRVKLVCLFPFDRPPKSVSKNDFMIQITPVNRPGSATTPLKLKTILSPFSTLDPLLGHKTLAYTHSFFFRKDALKSGFDDVLLYNSEQLLMETSFANIFLVKNKKIYTPKLANGILPGTVRTLLIQALNVEETDIPLKALKEFENCFLSSSVSQIHPVGQIDQLNILSDDTFLGEVQNSWNIIKRDYRKNI